jgi:sugar O-acyltransferase (sialic acid O-acetyltransferase NeuD family)
MIITLIGTSGLAKDLIGIFGYENYIREIVLFDNVNEHNDSTLYGKYKIITKLEDLKEHFISVSPFYIIAIASPKKRKFVSEMLINAGGINISYFCSKSLISRHTAISEKGVIIQMHSQISSDVVIDEGVFINVRCMLGHDVKIGEYTTLSPDVKILGNVTIGKNCVIATGVTIMPNVKIGNNVKIGMNKLVESDILDNTRLL